MQLELTSRDVTIILQALDKAFRYLDQVVPQPGRSVDMLAEARREYRLLWVELSKTEPENSQK